MNRKVLLLSLVVSLMGFSLFAPSTNYDDSLTRSLLNPNSIENVPSGIGDNFENFIDTLSDLHSPSDIGTHNVFSDLQDFGMNYDQMTETDTGSAGYNLEDYVDQQSNLHDPTDVGTHSDFTEMQDADSVYDTLTEANTGVTGGSEFLYVDGFDNTTVTWQYYVSSPYLSAIDYPTAYIAEDKTDAAVSEWFSFADTSLTGTGITVNISLYCMSPDSDDQVIINIKYDASHNWIVGTITMTTPIDTWAWYTITLNGTYSATQVNAMTARLEYNAVTGGDYLYVDAGRIGTNRIDTTNYDLDLEVGWTAAQYSEVNEYLCIYGGTQGAEALRVDVWNGAWINVISDLTSGWNNVSITSYLTSSSLEIRFTDTSNESTLQDTWQVDGVLLHVWTVGSANYELDLEVGWTTADYKISLET